MKAAIFQVSLNRGHINSREAHLRKVEIGSKMQCVHANTKVLPILVALASVCTCELVFAQQATPSPAELVREAVANEVAASQSDAKMMFLDRKATPRGSQTKLIVETKEGNAGMLVTENDHALTTARQRDEENRLARLMNSPEDLRKKQRSEKEDADRIRRIVKALPDAFVYEADGTQKGTAEIGRADAELVRLKFHPNPKYDPPSRLEQVLTGLEGTMLIDPQQHRIALMDGSLKKDVNFGWGFLGHLDKGGHYLVQQAEVVDGNWEIKQMILRFTGRVLLVKSIEINTDEVASDFHVVPSALTFAQGVDLLKKHEIEMAGHRDGAAGTDGDSDASKRF